MLGVESVLVGRHLLMLNDAGPWSASGPADPELHVLGMGYRCTVVTDGERYLVAGGAVPAVGAAAYIAVDGASVLPQATGQDSGQPGRVMGAGERALRQLIDDGLI